jgi:exosortase
MPTADVIHRQRSNISQRRALIYLCGLFGLILAPTLGRWVSWWRLDPNYAHGWLVLGLGGYLLGQALRTTARGVPRLTLGVCEFGAGAVLHLASQVVPWPLLQFAALFLMLRGCLLAVGGTSWAGAGLVPSLFFIFMFPLPVSWSSAIAVWLQEQVSWLSAGFLNLYWVCVRRGCILYLAGFDLPLVVAEACSGLRQLVAFAALAVLLGQWLKRPGWQILLLVIAAVPAAIMANTLRIVLMAALAQALGSDWLQSWLHDLPALLTIPLGIAMLAGVARLFPDAPRANEPVSTVAPLHIAPALYVGFSCVLLAQMWLGSHLAAAPATPPQWPRSPLAQFPLSLNLANQERWLGQDQTLGDAALRQLDFADEFIQRRYHKTAGGAWFDLYAVFSSQGRDREHHPEICVRDVGGAAEEPEGRQVIALGRLAAAQRFQFRAAQVPLTIYYWHYTFADQTAPASRSFLQRLHLRLARRPASMTVQVTTSLSPAGLASIEQAVLPALHENWLTHVPPSARVGCDRLPIRLAWED